MLRERGLDPAPERIKRTTWRGFLATHWGVMAAADFFTVEVWLPRGLTVAPHRFYMPTLSLTQSSMMSAISRFFVSSIIMWVTPRMPMSSSFR